MSDNDEWTARYNEASEATARMRRMERRAHSEATRTAYRRAGDDANAICCVMLRSYRGA